MDKEDRNGEKYVTYKWFLASLMSMLGVIIMVNITLSQIESTKLDKKLDKETYEQIHSALCQDVSEIKGMVKDILKEDQNRILLLEKRQTKVLQKLNIPE
jgi:hypothetical protein